MAAASTAQRRHVKEGTGQTKQKKTGKRKKGKGEKEKGEEKGKRKGKNRQGQGKEKEKEKEKEKGKEKRKGNCHILMAQYESHIKAKIASIDGNKRRRIENEEKYPQPHPHARTIAQNRAANERPSREKGKKDCSNQQNDHIANSKNHGGSR